MKIIRITLNKISWFIGLFCIPFIAFTQIQGSIIDTNNQPLSFANVLLLTQMDSSIVSGVMATEEGVYRFTDFKPGRYILRISMIGYKTTYSPPFTIFSPNDNLHNEPTVVEEDSYQLDDINIVAQKPVYELKVDRMVVNIENSITAAGNSVLEVLEKSPGVIVDRQNNGLSLSGKSGVTVMINGKQNRMPMAAAFQMLEAMRADNIKQIELITAPPARYDAEGDAGIINIILKKKEGLGSNGSVALTAGYGKQEKINGSLNLNLGLEKINYYGLYNIDYNNTYQTLTIDRFIRQTGSVFETYTKSIRDADVVRQNARIGFDYTISTKTFLGVLFEGYIRDFNKVAINDIFYKEDQQPAGQSSLRNPSSDTWLHGMGNINLQHHFKENEIIDINLDYLNYSNNNPSSYIMEKNDYDYNEPFEEIDIKKSTPVNIYVGALDYTFQVRPKLKFEAGIKATLSKFKNDFGVRYLNSGIWTNDEDLTNIYWLNENISAAYSSLNYKINDKTSLAAGLRYEYLNSVMNSETEQGIVDLHYGEFFPTLYLSKQLNKNNKIQFSYSKRITRPAFNELAPYIILLSPGTYIKGNENLLPAVNKSINMNYQYKIIILSISYTDTENAIYINQPTYDEKTGNMFYSSQNIANRKTVSAMFNFPLKVTDWWKMKNTVNWVMQKVKTPYDNRNISLDQNNYSINSVQSILIDKKLSAEISGFYRSKSLSGILERKPFGRLDIGFMYKFKNGNSQLNLNFTDVFFTNTIRWETNREDMNHASFIKYVPETRMARITFTHNFGKASAKARSRKTGSEDERSRIE